MRKAQVEGGAPDVFGAGSPARPAHRPEIGELALEDGFLEGALTP